MAWSERRVKAVCSAVAAMLAGEDNAGDWPEDVTRRDLEGAPPCLQRISERSTEAKLARESRAEFKRRKAQGSES